MAFRAVDGIDFELVRGEAFGEVRSAVLGGAVSSAAFVVCMLALGVVDPPWILLALPGLFATTFYPLSIYPPWLRPVIEALPLYHAIELVRGPALGAPHLP